MMSQTNRAGSNQVRVDGILNVLKPPGKTSFDVVSHIRRLSGEPRVGHTGTLDPEATGVLVVCLGQGTRMIEFLAKADKSYRAEIELGVSTDTDDATGTALTKSDIGSVTEQDLRRVINAFCGVQEQVPPMYCALKQQGKRLYELARKGIEVPRRPRKVHIFRLVVLDWTPPVVTIELDCSSGTYVRSLARDIGESLGCGAHLRRLVRLAAEPFHIDDSVGLGQVEQAFFEGWWSSLLYSMDEVLLEWKAAILGREEESRIRNGIPVGLPFLEDVEPSASTCRAYSTEGHFVAVLRLDGELWRPRKVFRSPILED